MTPSINWEDHVWKDPEGGSIHLHAVIPCTVWPRSLRPRVEWDGVAFLEPEGQGHAWDAEEAAEKESEGINFAEVLMGGGTTAVMLETIDILEDVKGPRFPDPEPRRLQRLANKNDRSVFFVEPDLDDRRWARMLEDQATHVTRWWNLLSSMFSKRRFKRLQISLSRNERPIEGMSAELFLAGCLSAAWWIELDSRLSVDLRRRRDDRLAARLRGCLQHLRDSKENSDVVLLLVHHVGRRGELLDALDRAEVEFPSFVTTNSVQAEE